MFHISMPECEMRNAKCGMHSEFRIPNSEFHVVRISCG